LLALSRWSPPDAASARAPRPVRRLGTTRMDRPVLFCYDGSDGSKAALVAAAELVAHPADAVV
jgi:hypothetical protein